MIDVTRNARSTTVIAAANTAATDEINKQLDEWKVPKGGLREHLLRNARGAISNGIELFFLNRKDVLEGYANRKPDLTSISPEEVAMMDEEGDLQRKVAQSLVTMAAKPVLNTLKSLETQTVRHH